MAAQLSQLFDFQKKQYFSFLINPGCGQLSGVSCFGHVLLQLKSWGWNHLRLLTCLAAGAASPQRPPLGYSGFSMWLSGFCTA